MTYDPRGREISGPLIWLLAIALTVSGATQLRFWGPIGPGECLLVAWAAVALWRRRHQLSLTDSGRPWLYFLPAAAALLVLGALVAGSRAGLLAPNALRDAIALLFSAGLVVVAVLTMHGEWSVLVRRLLILSALLYSAIYVLGGLGLEFYAFDPWWPFRGRYRALAVNPNQLAFQLTVLPFLAFFLLSRRTDRVVLASAMPLVWLSLATGSKSVVASWGIGLAALAVVVWFRWPERRRPGLGSQARMLLIFMLAATTLTLTLIWPHQQELRAYFGTHLGLGYSEEELTPVRVRKAYQIRNRVWLLKHGLMATGDSPLVGLGPGTHSGLAGPHLGGESHNSTIDWVASTGGLGLIAALLLVGSTVLRTWRNQPELLPALATLLTYAQFHGVLRQPLLWLLLVAFLDMSTPCPVLGGDAKVSAPPAPDSQQVRLSHER